MQLDIDFIIIAKDGDFIIHGNFEHWLEEDRKL